MSSPPEKSGPTGEGEAKALAELPDNDSGSSAEQVVSALGGMKPGTPDWQATEISTVASAENTKTSSTTVADILDAIKSGKWAREVRAITAKYTSAFEAAKLEGKADPAVAAKEVVRKDKEKLTGILFSGSFSRRASEALQTHSGILCLDMDNCAAPAELRAKLANDRHVLFALTSPTGSGVKAGVRIRADASAHASSFEAAKKHFRETYGVTVDEACKDVSRLCFATYDPDAFIREADAEILEPLPPPPAGKPRVILPKAGFVTNPESAEQLFKALAASPGFYQCNGLVGCVEPDKFGVEAFSPFSENRFRSQIERVVDLCYWYRGGLRRKALCGLDHARVFLEDAALNLLPPLHAIHRSPILVEMPDGSLSVLGPGYHKQAGGRLIVGGKPPVDMNFDEAREVILNIVREVKWFEPSDLSRFICALLEPAFKALCPWSFPSPLFLLEADASQAGKGLLSQIICAIYRELPALVSQRKGVGGFDESVSEALLKAKPIIIFDNFRGALASQQFETVMTCPPGSTVGARVPYIREVHVDPHAFVFLLTSNGLVTTKDLSNRSCIIRIVCQPDRVFARYPEGSLIKHVVATQEVPLGAAHRLVREWVALGKPFSWDDYRGVGAFREWWQRSDAVIAKLFLGLASPLAGHRETQRRTSDPVLGWLRELFLVLKDAGYIVGVRPLSATDILDFCVSRSIEIPCTPGASRDDKSQALRIGRLLARFFSPVNCIYEVEGFSVKRFESEPYPDRFNDCMRTAKKYLFFEGPEPPVIADPFPDLYDSSYGPLGCCADPSPPTTPG